METSGFGRRIIAITRDPFRPQDFRRSRWTGRLDSVLLDPSYTLFVERDATLQFQRLPPELVAKIFEDAGAELPEPSGLGLYPHEISVRRKQTAKIVLGAIAIAVILAWITRLLIRLRKARSATI